MNDPNPVRTRARARRRVELIGAWVLVGLLTAALLTAGPWVLVVPLGFFVVVVAVNTLALAQRRGPEERALTPGRLARAGPDDDPVSVPAEWAPRRHAPERRRHQGRLGFDGTRVSFVVDHGPTGRQAGTGSPLAGLAVLDAEPWELRLGPPPTLWRPQLVLYRDDTVHLLDLVPGWDLAGVGVGVLVAGAWYDQLREIGVRVA